MVSKTLIRPVSGVAWTPRPLGVPPQCIHGDISSWVSEGRGWARSNITWTLLEMIEGTANAWLLLKDFPFDGWSSTRFGCLTCSSESFLVFELATSTYVCQKYLFKAVGAYFVIYWVYETIKKTSHLAAVNLGIRLEYRSFKRDPFSCSHYLRITRKYYPWSPGITNAYYRHMKGFKTFISIRFRKRCDNKNLQKANKQSVRGL